jgi:hypothetical protein
MQTLSVLKMCVLIQLICSKQNKTKQMKSLLFSCYLFACTCAYGQDYSTFTEQANRAYNEKKYLESVIAFQEAFKIEQKKSGDFYNAACAAALAGDKTLAFNWLEASIERGWMGINHMKKDEDLVSLHDAEEWKKIIAQLQQKVDAIEAQYDKPLQATLLKILEDDQKYRIAWDTVQEAYQQQLFEKMHIQDSINLIKITAILDKNGWVSWDKVGSHANSTLFLVIQHADLATQQKYLPMMRTAAQNNALERGNLAMLEDRMALREGKKQNYGSQISKNKNGKFYVRPLEAPELVDKRRAAVDLEPLAIYLRHWKLIWDVETYKKELPEIEIWEKEFNK